MGFIRGVCACSDIGEYFAGLSKLWRSWGLSWHLHRLAAGTIMNKEVMVCKYLFIGQFVRVSASWVANCIIGDKLKVCAEQTWTISNEKLHIGMYPIFVVSCSVQYAHILLSGLCVPDVRVAVLWWNHYIGSVSLKLLFSPTCQLLGTSYTHYSESIWIGV